MTGENNVLLPSLGGVELVLSALEKHSSHAGVQEVGLAALHNLAVNGSLGGRRLLTGMCDDSIPTMTGQNSALVASLGGVGLVLSAMRDHSSHVRVQESGLAALRNLVVSGSLGVWRLLSDACDNYT